MDENEGTRITAMIRDVGPGIVTVRVAPTMPSSAKETNHKLCLAHEPSSLDAHIQTFTRSTHTHRRPSNTRRLSSVMSVRRLHREVHGGICCADGDLILHQYGWKLHHMIERRDCRPHAARIEWNAESTGIAMDCGPEIV